jgi:hypothetical protein
MSVSKRKSTLPHLRVLAVAIGSISIAGQVHAAKLSQGGDWDVNLDTTIQYNVGVRAQARDSNIANHPFFDEGDYKFDRGDLVTNRLQALVELQGVYKGQSGFRLSATGFKDFAYDTDVKGNPAGGPVYGLSYLDGKYSDETKKYHLQGVELLDAFAFHNTDIGNVPVYLKAGRFTQYWGNSFFFGFSNIAYGQHSVDYIKGFSQPGTEVKELFLPRTQVMASADLTPELSVSAQYFLEYRPNRYPEGGTYLGPFDILYTGPNALGSSGSSDNQPDHNNGNFGVKAAWSPEWAKGDIGFYYRVFDEVHPWPTAGDPSGRVALNYAEKTKLYGISYERTFGTISTGWELSYRQDTALMSSFVNPTGTDSRGATGDIVNVIANALVSLGSTPLWDAGNLIAEVSYTHLVKVNDKDLFNGKGYASCRNLLGTGPGDTKDGCATRNALALAFLFEPQWLQVMPGVDLSMPLSVTYGIKGNPAYVAGAFYAEEAQLYSIGLKAVVDQKHSVTLQYNGYHYNTGPVNPAAPGFGYAGFGGNGAVALNDKGWVQLMFKTSF